MFTGIVQGAFEVDSCKRGPDSLRLGVSLNAALAQGLIKGASVAVNGVCLTVSEIAANHVVYFDLVNESLRRTNFAECKKGDLVNVERSLKVGDEIGGHFCSGHVDGTCSVISIHDNQSGKEIEFSIAPELGKYIFEKGFVALNGASLTIAKKQPRSFVVALIPETLLTTNLERLQKGSIVNIEIDKSTQTIVETVERVMKSIAPSKS